MGVPAPLRHSPLRIEDFHVMTPDVPARAEPQPRKDRADARFCLRLIAEDAVLAVFHQRGVERHYAGRHRTHTVSGETIPQDKVISREERNEENAQCQRDIGKQAAKFGKRHRQPRIVPRVTTILSTRA
jgi:hypothetical protein